MPTYQETTVTLLDTAANPQNVDMPATVDEGDLLVMALGSLNHLARIPDGWEYGGRHTPDTSLHHTVLARVADGTEGGASVSVPWDGSATGAVHVLRFSDWFGDLRGLVVSAATGGTSSTPTAATVTNRWGEEETTYVWLCAMSDDGGNVTVAPSGYGNLQSDDNGRGGNSSSSIASAVKTATASSDSPGTATIDEAERWSTFVLAIAPSGIDIDFPFPVEAVPSTGASSTTHSVDMPATVEAGELLLIDICLDEHPNATPDGWTQLAQANKDTDTFSTVYGRVADGTEGGTSVDINTAGSSTFAAVVLRYQDWGGDLSSVELNTAVTGVTSAPNADSLTPSWGAKNTTWSILASGRDKGDSLIHPPDFYTLAREAVSSLDGVWVAHRFLNAASEDPGGLQVASNNNVVVWLMAVESGDAAEPGGGGGGGGGGGEGPPVENLYARRRLRA